MYFLDPYTILMIDLRLGMGENPEARPVYHGFRRAGTRSIGQRKVKPGAMTHTRIHVDSRGCL